MSLVNFLYFCDKKLVAKAEIQTSFLTNSSPAKNLTVEAAIDEHFILPSAK